MSPGVLLLSLCGNPSAHFEHSVRDIRRAVKRAVPFMERAKGMIFREFLASDLTVKDMQTRLGKKRPSDIFKMMLTFTKKELQTGFFMDQISEAFDVDMNISIEPLSCGHHIHICSFLDWLERDTDTLTDNARAAFAHYLTRPDLQWPNEFGREHARQRLASLTKMS